MDDVVPGGQQQAVLERLYQHACCQFFLYQEGAGHDHALALFGGFDGDEALVEVDAGYGRDLAVVELAELLEPSWPVGLRGGVEQGGALRVVRLFQGERSGIVGTAVHSSFVPIELRGVQVGVVVPEVANGEIDGIAFEIDEGRRGAEMKFHIGVPGDEVGQSSREPFRGKARRHGQRDALAAPAFQLPAGIGDLRKCRLDVPPVGQTLGRWQHLARLAYEQSGAQPFFQLLNLLPNGARRYAQFLRGKRKAAVTYRCIERNQRFKRWVRSEEHT